MDGRLIKTLPEKKRLNFNITTNPLISIQTKSESKECKSRGMHLVVCLPIGKMMRGSMHASVVLPSRLGLSCVYDGMHMEVESNANSSSFFNAINCISRTPPSTRTKSNR